MATALSILWPHLKPLSFLCFVPPCETHCRHGHTLEHPRLSFELRHVKGVSAAATQVNTTRWMVLCGVIFTSILLEGKGLRRFHAYALGWAIPFWQRMMPGKSGTLPQVVLVLCLQLRSQGKMMEATAKVGNISGAEYWFRQGLTERQQDKKPIFQPPTILHETSLCFRHPHCFVWWLPSSLLATPSNYLRWLQQRCALRTSHRRQCLPGIDEPPPPLSPSRQG